MSIRLYSTVLISDSEQRAERESRFMIIEVCAVIAVGQLGSVHKYPLQDAAVLVRGRSQISTAGCGYVG